MTVEIKNKAMTMQVKEQLIYKNERYEMSEEPLEQYLLNMKDEPAFHVHSSNCWRGYYGTWKLKGEKLYLIELIASTEEGKKVGVEDLFPEKKEVFADWFSGEIKVLQAELSGASENGYKSEEEQELFLDFQNGVLMDDIV